MLPAGCEKPDLKTLYGIKTVWKHSPDPMQTADTQVCHKNWLGDQFGYNVKFPNPKQKSLCLIFAFWKSVETRQNKHGLVCAESNKKETILLNHGCETWHKNCTLQWIFLILCYVSNDSHLPVKIPSHLPDKILKEMQFHCFSWLSSKIIRAWALWNPTHLVVIKVFLLIIHSIFCFMPLQHYF